MSCKILVVEDEIFVAAEIEHVVTEMGHVAVGVAADKVAALKLAPDTDVALVDLNLHDGPTGIAIGRILAQSYGVTVLFMTANPAQLGRGVSGTLGVLPKPVGGDEMKQAVAYAVAQREKKVAKPPRRLQLFNWNGTSALLA
ncbi:response regulator [Devosia algicola]|uniref:Response regulator n=1 Tax=Devosia algicola TaxID=3026418 RepID=A0ABY7YNF9_9HYPH|nr:response regulator [Devosia algicola]WDR02806.1 response regulator [Devosia algicola]